MTTAYTTLRGVDYDPVPVELWSWQGERLGKLGAFSSLTFTDTIKPGRAASATIETYLSELTAQLLPCDGTVLVAAHYNGKTLLYAPVTADVHSLDEAQDVAVLTVQCVGGWAFMEGTVTTPALRGDVMERPNATFELTGALETVVKTLVAISPGRNNHPIVVVPSSGRGPTVTAKGAWETVGEVIAKLLTGTGYALTFNGWTPSDQQPLDGYTLTAPCYVVDVVPHTPRVGLVWSYLGGDLSKWSVSRKRASATRAIASNGADSVDERDIARVTAAESVSPWARREVYVRHTPEKDENNDPIRLHDDLVNAAALSLTEHAAALEVSAVIENSAGWEYGTDKATPRQYVLGDIATIDVPVLGEFMQVITDIDIHITPTELTVTPTVGTPDTLELSSYDTVARLDKRISQLERKR